MTYATSNDIVHEFKAIAFTATSDVTDTAVSDFLEQADALIDMHIGKRYDTPVAATDSVLVLKKIAIDIVVFRIAKILDLKKSLPIGESNVIQDITNGDAYKESMKLLAAIRDDKMDLPDVTEIDGNSGLQSFHTQLGNADIVPYFQKGVEQW